MSDVPSNLIPLRLTGLPEYLGTSTLGYLPYVIEGNTYKVQFANIAAVGAVPSTRLINTGSGLGGGGDLSANRTLYILPEGVDDSRLTTTGVTASTYGAADSIPVFTVNAQGRVTGVTDTPIVLTNYVPTSRTITAGAGLTGGGDLSTNRTFAVNFSNTTPEPLGPGSSGVSTVAAREDHVHPAVDLSDTTETQGVLPLSRGGTGNSLSPVVGAIAYSSNDKLYLTPTAGDAGQVLTSDGGGVPYWSTVTAAGTVTSVNASGGTTGLSFTGGPITTSGTLTLGGTLAVANGGTGATDAATALTNLGAYPASNPAGYTTNVGTVTSVDLTAGTGVSVSGGPITSSGSITVTNTAPDQVVSLTAGANVTITGTYPNFTIAASGGGGSGTVTSVAASGGTTGLTFSGSPITTSGTLTLGGTLTVANGGTGATTLSSGYLIKGNGASAVSASVVYDDGTNVGIGTTTPAALLSISQNGGGDIGALVSQTNSGNGTTGRYRATHGSGAAVNLEAGNGYVAVNATSASPLLFNTSGTERFRVGSAGQWGIGGANYGTAGQVFTSGGSGAVPTWTTPTTGTVTSVDVSGGTTGLTTSGGPVTSSGTITLAGTLAVANGGTGTTTAFTTGSVVFAGASGVYSQDNANFFWNDSTNRLGLGTTSPLVRLHVSGGTGILVEGNGASGYNYAQFSNDVSNGIAIGVGGSTASGWTQNLAAVFNASNNPIAFGTNNTERMRIDASGDVTLTNKIIPNVQSVASASTITPNANTDTQVSVTALAVPATIAAPSGTPSDGQSLVIRIEDNGTAQALTWTTGSSGAYRPVGITLPTTTVATKVVYVGFKYNSTDLRWDAIALSQEA